MTKKVFIACRLGVVVALGIIIAISIQFDNWVLPIVSMVAGMAVIYVCKKRVKAVLVDERDSHLAEKASRCAVSIFSIIGVMAGIVLIVLGKDNQDWYLVGNTLLYSICALMILSTIFYQVFNKKS